MSAITTILAPTLVPRPSNLPYTSLGTLFKGRDAFLTALHERLIGHGNTLFKGHAIHGLGGVGKTRAALEYAWRYQSHYTARLFVSADSPETLDTMLAALCQTDILNLPAKALTDQNEQKAAVLMWLNAHSGWLLILDNADSEDGWPQWRNSFLAWLAVTSSSPVDLPTTPVELTLWPSTSFPMRMLPHFSSNAPPTIGPRLRTTTSAFWNSPVNSVVSLSPWSKLQPDIPNQRSFFRHLP